MAATFSSTVRNQVQNARDMADDAMERASEAAARLQQDVDYLKRYLTTNASGMATAANDQLRNFGFGAEVVQQVAGTQASKLQRILFRQAARHPIGAIGVAALAGVLIGIYYARQAREPAPAAPYVRRRRSED
ncbi:hypothetical protein [Phreatobacter stygius]|uniref:DUF883 family protein n=1 Tax=Phreatobacter stygius TaxID=1940610 RepID=A0A4D7BH60_9HYPH|nr:hypothetical protein [Phreatobacter stygius]QCI68486.1 hypothetical protein E8M01_32225 [Phreatobacter stygius]